MGLNLGSVTGGAHRLSPALVPAVQAIARDALSIGVGGTLPTNAHYYDQLGLVAGTIQRALTLLRDKTALTITSRGHLGRTITDIDVNTLWTVAALPPVHLLCPPRGPAEIDALIELIADALSRLNISYRIDHLPGGRGRLAALDAGESDIALVSAGVARTAMAVNEFHQRALPNGSYYGPGRLVMLTRADLDRPIHTVGIDPDSPDHTVLTRAEFPPLEFEHRPMPFPLVPKAVAAREIDAGIWHITKTFIPLDLAGLQTRPLTGPIIQGLWDELSSAVLVASPTRPELAGLMAELTLDDLQDAQYQAIHREFDGRT